MKNYFKCLIICHLEPQLHVFQGEVPIKNENNYGYQFVNIPNTIGNKATCFQKPNMWSAFDVPKRFHALI